jgi:hypothetical protein
MSSSRFPAGPRPGDRPCGIVGGGRLARHLSHYFRESGIAVRSWTRAEPISPDEALGDVPVVLVLIADDAIAPFIESQPALRSRVLVHCSGSLVTPLAHGMHPLMNFGPDLYGMAVYWAIPFVHDAGGPGIRDLFPALPNPSFARDPAREPLYHAMADRAGRPARIPRTRRAPDRRRAPRGCATPSADRPARPGRFGETATVPRTHPPPA